MVEIAQSRKPYTSGCLRPSPARGCTLLKTKNLAHWCADCMNPLRGHHTMNAFLATTCIVTGSLLAGGCATQKYVQNTTAPIQAKVDQVGEQTGRNGQQIEDTRNQVKQVDEKAQTGISAAQERAGAADPHAVVADQHAGEAKRSADQANKLGEKNSQELTGLRNVVANIDDYKLQTTVAVPFGFNKYELSADAKAELDTVPGE